MAPDPPLFDRNLPPSPSIDLESVFSHPDGLQAARYLVGALASRGRRVSREAPMYDPWLGTPTMPDGQDIEMEGPDARGSLVNANVNAWLQDLLQFNEGLPPAQPPPQLSNARNMAQVNMEEYRASLWSWRYGDVASRPSSSVSMLAAPRSSQTSSRGNQAVFTPPFIPSTRLPNYISNAPPINISHSLPTASLLHPTSLPPCFHRPGDSLRTSHPNPTHLPPRPLPPISLHSSRPSPLSHFWHALGQQTIQQQLDFSSFAPEQSSIPPVHSRARAEQILFTSREARFSASPLQGASPSLSTPKNQHLIPLHRSVGSASLRRTMSEGISHSRPSSSSSLPLGYIPAPFTSQPSDAASTMATQSSTPSTMFTNPSSATQATMGTPAIIDSNQPSCAVSPRALDTEASANVHAFSPEATSAAAMRISDGLSGLKRRPASPDQTVPSILKTPDMSLSNQTGADSELPANLDAAVGEPVPEKPAVKKRKRTPKNKSTAGEAEIDPENNDTGPLKTPKKRKATSCTDPDGGSPKKKSKKEKRGADDPKAVPAKCRLGDNIWMRILELTPPSFLGKARLVNSDLKAIVDQFTSIYTNCRKENYGFDMPPPPEGMTERQYNNLLGGGKSCMNPKCPTGDKKASKTYWSWYRRWCNTCWSSAIQREDAFVIQYQSRDRDRALLQSLFACIPSGMQDSFFKAANYVEDLAGRPRHLPKLYKCYLSDDVARVIAEYDDLTPPPFVSDPTKTDAENNETERDYQATMLRIDDIRKDFLAERRAKNAEHMARVLKIEAGIKMRRGINKKPHDHNRSARRDLYISRAKADLPEVDEWFIPTSKAFKRATRVYTTAGSERSWQILKPKILEEWNSRQEGDKQLDDAASSQTQGDNEQEEDLEAHERQIEDWPELETSFPTSYNSISTLGARYRAPGIPMMTSTAPATTFSSGSMQTAPRPQDLSVNYRVNGITDFDQPAQGFSQAAQPTTLGNTAMMMYLSDGANAYSYLNTGRSPISMMGDASSANSLSQSMAQSFTMTPAQSSSQQASTQISVSSLLVQPPPGFVEEVEDESMQTDGQ